jgi:hypothetical protein
LTLGCRRNLDRGALRLRGFRFFLFYRNGLVLWYIRCRRRYGRRGLLQWLVSRCPVRPRWRGRLVLLDKVARKQALFLVTTLIDVFSNIPVVALLLSDCYDLSRGEVEIVLVG